MSFGQFAATSQFYLYGRWYCTSTGWENAYKKYPKPDELEDPNLNLANKVYLITGANAGIGREMTKFFASRGAAVFMICRSADRARKAQQEIIEETKNSKVHVLLGDCGLESDIRRLWSEFCEHSDSKVDNKVRLDCLICNAGALLNHRTLTSEGVEVTFATHLLFGTYLLTSLAIPTLEANPDQNGRVVAVSSGGMYNTKFPSWDLASATSSNPYDNTPPPYDGQFAYAYAKRAQVLLCEELAKKHSKISFFSSHPGWVQTEAVDAAYGESKKYLEPLRNTWQGAEGIIWLAVANKNKLKSGEFYLDRESQRKHLSGAFFSEGSFTKNTPQEVQEMMEKLEKWSNSVTREQDFQETIAKNLRTQPLQATSKPIPDIKKFMGSWYVLGSIPTSLEVGISNGIENYTYEPQDNSVKVHFTYYKGSGTENKPTYLDMRGRIANSPVNTYWKMDPKVYGVHVPLAMDYLVLDYDEELGYTIIGVPDRAYLWIMIRETPSCCLDIGRNLQKMYESYDYEGRDSAATRSMVTSADEEYYIQNERAILKKALMKCEELGIDLNKIVRVPWDSSL